MFDWRIGVHYREQFIGVRQSNRVRNVWWIWSCLISLLSSGNSICLLREVVSYGQNEVMYFGYWNDDGSDNILSPHLKWAWRRRWMKMSQCLIDEVTVDLTGMTSLSIGDGVRDHPRPIVAKSSKLDSELRSMLVSSAHTIVSFPECLLCFFVWKVAE